MPDHVFWWFLTMASVVWYSTITVYVSVKGVADIRDMLRRLSERKIKNARAAENRDNI